MNKIIITGAPCSGKTSLINELLRRGYSVIPEAAQFLINEEISAHGNIFPWTNPKEFQNKIYKVQVQWEDVVSNENGIVFLDRSLIDCIAYCLFNNIDIPNELRTLIDKANYSKAYFLELLPENYWRRTLTARPRHLNYEDGTDLQRLMDKTYTMSGVEKIKIPFLPVHERANIIEMHLGLHSMYYDFFV